MLIKHTYFPDRDSNDEDTEDSDDLPLTALRNPNSLTAEGIKN